MMVAVLVLNVRAGAGYVVVLVVWAVLLTKLFELIDRSIIQATPDVCC